MSEYSLLLIVVSAVLTCVMYVVWRYHWVAGVMLPQEVTVHVHVGSVGGSDLGSDAECESEVMESEDEIGSENESEGTCFVVDSLTLFTAYGHLFGETSSWRAGSERWQRGFREVFCYLTGVRVASERFVLTHLVPVRFAEQHAAGVRVDQASNIETFTALDSWGLALAGHCHSHPGQFGADATHPSMTDMRFQTRLEKGGCRAIGLIFSRSHDGYGYVRFFAGEGTRFSVEVQGACVEQVEDHVFRLSLDNIELPIRTIVAGQVRKDSG